MMKLKKNRSEKDMKKLLLIIIVISISFIFIFGYIIYNEISSAKKECDNIKGIYSLDDFQHFCNDELFYKYSDGTWDFERVELDFDKVMYWNESD